MGNFGKFMEKTVSKIADTEPIGRTLQGKSLNFDKMSKAVVDPFGHLGINKEKQVAPNVAIQGEAQYAPLGPQQTGGDLKAVARGAFSTQMELENQRALQAFRNSRGNI